MNDKIPRHVVIIPDGNRRWAREKGLVKTAGHVRGGSYDSLRALFDEARKLGAKHFSLWGFSTENWKRDQGERDKIFEVISKILDRLFIDAKEEGIRFRHIGRRDRLPKELVEKMLKLEGETERNENYHVNLCLDYGGEEEIVRAINGAVRKGEEVSEENLGDCFYTKDLPNPDLIIRTGGERRLSGFMPLQSIYSELYFTDVNFPDFGPAELREAVRNYSERQRRFGGD